MVKNKSLLSTILNMVCVLLMVAILVTQFLPFWSYSEQLNLTRKQATHMLAGLMFNIESNPNNAPVYGEAIAVNSNDAISLSVDVKGGEKAARYVALRFYADDETPTETGHISEVTATSITKKWDTLTLEASAPADAKFVRVWLWADDCESANNHYFDNVILKNASQPDVENLLADYNFSFEETLGESNRVANWYLCEEAYTVSIADYVWFPNHNKALHSILAEYIYPPLSTIELSSAVNKVVQATYLMIACIAAVVVLLVKLNKKWAAIVPLAAGVVGLFQYLGNHLFQLGMNWQVHMILCAVAAAVACVNVVLWIVELVKKDR